MVQMFQTLSIATHLSPCSSSTRTESATEYATRSRLHGSGSTLESMKSWIKCNAASPDSDVRVGSRSETKIFDVRYLCFNGYVWSSGGGVSAWQSECMVS
jgi:hypothetical protein